MVRCLQLSGFVLQQIMSRFSWGWVVGLRSLLVQARLMYCMVYFSDHSQFLRFSSRLQLLHLCRWRPCGTICAWMHSTDRASIAPNWQLRVWRLRCSPIRLISDMHPVPAILKSSLPASENMLVSLSQSHDNDDTLSQVGYLHVQHSHLLGPDQPKHRVDESTIRSTVRNWGGQVVDGLQKRHTATRNILNMLSCSQQQWNS
jgi:hypothetical protein